ncbi:MAG: flagellar filament capping protein FliD [Campylobacterota bacterium]|nr:flagellar filament capping protein FliD [Campylobacterota bacterium]
MGISSLGAGSSILTQDVLDQLRAADEAKFVAPLDSRLDSVKDESAAFDVLDAHMDNVYGSLKSLTEYGVFESRTASSSNEDFVGVSALESSDVQDFTIEVGQLATKEIVQSGQFSGKDALISDGTGGGQLELSVGSESYTIDYAADTTLEGLKELINKNADEGVTASIVQINDGDFRLVLSAVESGEGQGISITDVVGQGETLLDALKPDPDAIADPSNLVDGMTSVQAAVNAEFKYNGIDIIRTDNSVDDLLSGVTLTLKDAEVGKVMNISVQQNSEHIEERFTNFIDKYNSAMFQLDTDTKSSQDVSERGVFSSDSTIKGMKNSLISMLASAGEGVGKLEDFGIELDDDGRLSLDAEVLNTKLSEDPVSVQAFFIGGTFTNEDGNTTEVTGAFVEMEDEVAKYSKYNNVLDQFKDSMKTRYDSLTEQKEKAIERLDASYAIQAKKFAAYDLIISKFNTASNMFTQMINAEIAANS